jgi:hypothetical protein
MSAARSKGVYFLSIRKKESRLAVARG